MKKAEKYLFVENLVKELQAAKSVVLINFAGLSVVSQQELKRRLKAVDAKMLVVKNTLLKKAGEAAKIAPQTLTEAVLSGQTALIIANGDPAAFIQVLGKFTQEFSVPQMKIGLVEGALTEKESLAKIAALPSRDALLGQLLGTLLASPTALIGTLESNSQKLISILKTKAG